MIPEYNQEYWDKRLDDNIPEKVKTAIKRIYNSFPKEEMPQGLCDPMYIMNVICYELGIGDGKSNFNL